MSSDHEPPNHPNGPDHHQQQQQQLALLQTLTDALSSASRRIPTDRDFHFFNNFPEFRSPVDSVSRDSLSLLSSVRGVPMSAFDDEEWYHWLVDFNDHALEGFDVAAEDFERSRKEEDAAVGGLLEEGGFEVVKGRKKRDDRKGFGGAAEVKVAADLREKRGKVSFHISTIRRPQDEFNILVNNSNQPFQHVWLQRSDDGSRFVHPLENVSVLDFIDRSIPSAEPQKPSPPEDTPFKLVEDVRDLKAMAVKLRAATEFAVDLEHNQYRSFQGLTCLMQISTRDEDFIVDALKLKVHIGPHLREVFKDCSKRKVLHGADHDILWLQRDFGIYVCNMFDTGQAARVLKLERFSLEYLLNHFCEVKANKEYQNADWRLRPLPYEMVRYAREDTHYLLHIYDLMKIRLISMSEGSEDALLEVYKRSADICSQLYEKELLTDSSYLHIYGLVQAQLSPQQLAVVAALHEWRDAIARSEDESTGFILPNKTLLEIATQLPVTTGKLHRLLKTRQHSYIECNLSSVVNIVRRAIQNSAAYEAEAESLKQKWLKKLDERAMAKRELQPTPPDADVDAEVDPDFEENQTIESIDESAVLNSISVNHGDPPQLVREESSKLETFCSELLSQDSNSNNNGESSSESKNERAENHLSEEKITKKGSAATVQVRKKPGGAFGAMLGNSGLKRKENKLKLEAIRSSVNLPFRTFSVTDEPTGPMAGIEEQAGIGEELNGDLGSSVTPQDSSALTEAVASKAEDVIMFDEEGGNSGSETGGHNKDDAAGWENSGEADFKDDEPVSLSELSSSFQKCLQSVKQNNVKTARADQPPISPFKPFDYEAAWKDRFGEDGGRDKQGEDGDASPRRSRSGRGGKKGGLVGNDLGDGNGSAEFGQGRRRQAFPASGNRSATFR
ncbi:hypothetical protein MLD38_004545 [Melastoma candidum]|uniref:Uncharacterized protein n=1 Tax=Melastoma candidum TaxID=119954 RepID=A0ACB9SAP1_9MYRT|nr:hypothetical protein MLD38_004545 [Melastoma candidum]